MRAYRKKKGVPAYVILPTLGCNARCVYCFEEGMKPVTMTRETAEQVIRYILDTHADGKTTLKWFGGEPLLGVKTIDRMCEGLREAGLEYTSIMISNGSLITPEIVQKMAGDWRLSFIQISMDGAERDYIGRKRYCDERNHYHRVMNAVSMMSEAGIRVTIRCNVDEDNWAGIPQFMQDLKVGVGNKDKVSVYFTPLYDVRMGENDLAMWEKIWEARHLIEEAGFRSTSRSGLGFRKHHCVADGGGVVIAPDGSLYPCDYYTPECRFGDIWHGVTDEAARREFCRVDRTREKCRTCPFLPDCTNFASCPIQDTHCRELREMMAMDTLGRMVDRKEETDGEDPNC